MNTLEFLVSCVESRWQSLAITIHATAHAMFHAIHPFEPFFAALVIILGLMGRCLTLPTFSAAVFVILTSLHDAFSQ